MRTSDFGFWILDCGLKDSRSAFAIQPRTIQNQKSKIQNCLVFLILLLFVGCGRRHAPDHTEYWWPEKILSPGEQQQEISEKTARVAALLRKEKLLQAPVTDPADLAWLSAGNEFQGPLLVRDDGSSQPLPVAMAAGAPPAVSLNELRVPLTGTEVRKYRWLGRRCAEAVEAVCRRLPRGMNERAIEALLSDALMRQAIHPARILLASDERIAESGAAPPEDERKADKALLVIVCGRRWGLHVALSRMIHFGPVPESLRREEEAVAAVNAGIWAKCWTGALYQGGEPGGAIGYRMDEWGKADRRGRTIASGQAYAWCPAFNGVRMEDTILILGDDLDVLTRTPDWPVIESRAQGRIYRFAAILSR